MALKKSQLYRSLWQPCDELRGSMDASQGKDYQVKWYNLAMVLVLAVSYRACSREAGTSRASQRELKFRQDTHRLLIGYRRWIKPEIGV